MRRANVLPVAAMITGEAVDVTVPGHVVPRLVRYGWKNWGPAPLFNEAGLPAAPFEVRLQE